jgi:hypothetical protein
MTSEDSFSFSVGVRGAFSNDDRFELTCQTAENRVRKIVKWSERGRSLVRLHLSVVTFGNEFIRLVILIGL